MPWKGIDQYIGVTEPNYHGPVRPMWAPDQEAEFWKWFIPIANQLGIDPDADNPEHQYDYREAFRQGFQPGASAHWPSELKYMGHPRRFINGYDTATGGLMPLVFPGMEEK